MSSGPLNITARIEKQEKKILQLTKELESAKDEYQKLIEEKEEEDRKVYHPRISSNTPQIIGWLSMPRGITL